MSEPSRSKTSFSLRRACAQQCATRMGSPLRRGPGFQTDRHRARDDLGPVYGAQGTTWSITSRANHQRCKFNRILRRWQHQPPFARQSSSSRNMVRRNTMTPRDGIHRDTRRQRLRHDPGLHLIGPLPVPTDATANRENLQCSRHGENPLCS